MLTIYLLVEALVSAQREAEESLHPIESNPKTEENSNIQRRLSTLALNYYGGPILTDVFVVPVFYNSDVLYQSEIEHYYGALIGGGDFISFIDSEYGSASTIPGSPINFGNVTEAYVASEIQTDITDVQIKSLLQTMFSVDPATLPKPSENTLYAVFISYEVSFYIVFTWIFYELKLKSFFV